MVSKTTYEVTKRIFDFLMAMGIGVVLLPLFVVIVVVIRITSPGPAIHWSRRIGINNVIFSMAKFRTMKTQAPQLATHLMTDPDRYLTRVGRFLRKYSLDELPQLYNIIKGDISLVGPRPALYNQNDLRDLRTAKGIHKIMPGLTGWAQINGRDELTIPAKVAFDEHYLKNRSLVFDVKILVMTALKALTSEGVNH